MKKHLKLILLAAAVLMLVIPFTVYGREASAADVAYVTDEAGTVSDEDEAIIAEEAAKLKNKYGATVYSIVKSKYSGKIDEYSYDIYKDLGFETDENRDVVIFVYEDDGEYWGIQGLGIQHKMSDDELGNYLDEYFADDFKKYDTGAAILSFIKGIDSFYEGFFADNGQEYPDGNMGPAAPQNSGCAGCGYNCINCGYGCATCGIGCGNCAQNCMRNCAYNCGGCGLLSCLPLMSCTGLGVFVPIIGIIVLISIISSIFSPRRGGYYGGYRGPRIGGFHSGFRGPRPGGFGGPGRGPGFGGPRPGGFGGGHSGGTRGAGGGGSRGAGGRR